MKYFDSWDAFLDYVKASISGGDFKDFLLSSNIKTQCLEVLWKNPDMYDMDYIEPDEWEGFKEMFPTTELYQKIIRIAPVIELRSYRIPVPDVDVIFYVAGEALEGPVAYLCYAYGFQMASGPDNMYNGFISLLNAEEG